MEVDRVIGELLVKQEEKIRKSIENLQAEVPLLYSRLLPLLMILADEDVPFDRVSWNSSNHHIELKDEMKLTKKAFRAILKIVRTWSSNRVIVRRYVQSSYIQLHFLVKDSYRSLLFVSNGAGTCEVNRIQKGTMTLPQWDYQANKSCPGLQLS